MCVCVCVCIMETPPVTVVCPIASTFKALAWLQVTIMCFCLHV